MRFMMIMLPGEQAEKGVQPRPERFAAMMKFNEDLMGAGVLLQGEGLHPSAKGARVHFGPGGQKTVVDGPFTEANGVIGGFWLIQVKSKEEAVAWATRCPCADDETLEIRQVQELTDFPADVIEATQDSHARLVEGLGRPRKS
jgi:hypothetical protein